MKTKATLRSGFTLVEIMIVVAIIGLLAAIAIPNYTKARETSQLRAIWCNLRIIEGAKDQWALDQRKGTGELPATSDIEPFMKFSRMPASVVGESYNINEVGISSTATLPGTVALGEIAKGGTVTIP